MHAHRGFGLLSQVRDALSRSSVLRGSCASGHRATPRISCNVECCSNVTPYHLVLRAAISPVYTTTNAPRSAMSTWERVIATTEAILGETRESRSRFRRYCLLKWPPTSARKHDQSATNFLKLPPVSGWQLTRRNTSNQPVEKPISRSFSRVALACPAFSLET